jgi:hypothetical protein
MDQHKRWLTYAEAGDRIACDEAAGLRAENDRLHARRLRNKR